MISHDAAAPTTAPTSTAAPATAKTTTDVAAIVDKVMPTVVEITVRTGNAQGLGSGVIITADGRILTNNHVVANAREITVTFSDGRTTQATVVGTDPNSDLAILQAEGVSSLPTATLGDSTKANIGDEVIAIGSPGGLRGTVTTGIISALNREVSISSERGSSVSYKAIQTDASINQGNSGGPLFDTAGRVIGINSAIYSPVSSSDGSAGSVGIGFSIPIDTAKELLGRFS
ncbi:S1C family serine protease [Actinokineospora sp. G85]|uniref:S1C family serine protease n=1 Tax=Actinokineospora sp. G85 TaxID=3406626 RepID=UPI003C7389AC